VKATVRRAPSWCSRIHEFEIAGHAWRGRNGRVPLGAEQLMDGARGARSTDAFDSLHRRAHLQAARQAGARPRARARIHQGRSGAWGTRSSAPAPLDETALARLSPLDPRARGRRRRHEPRSSRWSQPHRPHARDGRADRTATRPVGRRRASRGSTPTADPAAGALARRSRSSTSRYAISTAACSPPPAGVAAAIRRRAGGGARRRPWFARPRPIPYALAPMRDTNSGCDRRDGGGCRRTADSDRRPWPARCSSWWSC
jgi:hypothetical protein